MKLLNQVFPGFDIRSVGGFLQLLFVEFGMILAGLAAATLVAVWASDETSGRLEFLLATPLSRSRWVTSGGGGGLSSGSSSLPRSRARHRGRRVIAGSEIAAPVAGRSCSACTRPRWAGSASPSVALFRTSFAAPFVAVLTIVTWFIGIIGPALGLPDVVHDLALTSHYGFTMLGQWDRSACIASAISPSAAFWSAPGASDGATCAASRARAARLGLRRGDPAG